VCSHRSGRSFAPRVQPAPSQRTRDISVVHQGLHLLLPRHRNPTHHHPVFIFQAALGCDNEPGLCLKRELIQSPRPSCSRNEGGYCSSGKPRLLSYHHQTWATGSGTLLVPKSLTCLPSGTDRKFKACDTCRQRKQKCDEQRPKCGLCSRMKLECRYREPLPTK
jgi:hypothetical protein